jgi:hypothetical protein
MPASRGKLSLPGFRRPVLLALALVVLAGAIAGATFSAFSGQTDNSGDSVTAATDYRAPAIGALAVSKTQPGSPGFIKKGGTYYVYANVSADTGNPATGIASVTADASNLTTGQSNVAMASGSWTIAGQTYNYRSASLTADAALAAGSKPFTVTATDNASNSNPTSGTVTVDNTAPTGTDVQTANVAAGTAGKAEAGDSITYSFSEPIEPDSILSGWTGASQTVTLRLINGTSDTVQVWNAANTAQLPLGTVTLVGSYAGATRNFTNSTMTMSGNNVTVVLGTPSGGTTKVTTGGAMTWTPSTSTMDRAANAGSANVVTESGSPADVEF